MKELDGTIYSIITNAVGFALVKHESPGAIHNTDDGELWVDVSPEDIERARAVAKNVYVHLAEMGYLPYV